VQNHRSTGTSPAGADWRAFVCARRGQSRESSAPSGRCSARAEAESIQPEFGNWLHPAHCGVWKRIAIRQSRVSRGRQRITDVTKAQTALNLSTTFALPLEAPARQRVDRESGESEMNFAVKNFTPFSRSQAPAWERTAPRLCLDRGLATSEWGPWRARHPQGPSLAPTLAPCLAPTKTDATCHFFRRI